MKSIRHLAVLLAALTLFAVACGESTDDDAESTEAAESTDSEDAESADSEDAESDAVEPDEGAPIETVDSDDAAPQRIVSLSPSATEALFAIGAGEQVVAADQYSTYPPEAPTTELSGFDPNIEAIVAYEPDLVVISNDANDLVAGLEELDIAVLISGAPADIEGGYEAMAILGQAVGRIDETAEAVAALREEMAAAFADVPDVSGLRVYHELDDTFYSANSSSFIGAVYAQMGAENVADEADDEFGSGFPQLTEEYIVEADPQLIVITDQVSYTADDLAARPGWEEISAVQNENIVVVNADIASRWGPRLPEFVTAVAEAMSGSLVDS